MPIAYHLAKTILRAFNPPCRIAQHERIRIDLSCQKPLIWMRNQLGADGREVPWNKAIFERLLI